jgi:hypothetical protein
MVSMKKRYAISDKLKTVSAARAAGRGPGRARCTTRKTRTPPTAPRSSKSDPEQLANKLVIRGILAPHSPVIGQSEIRSTGSWCGHAYRVQPAISGQLNRHGQPEPAHAHRSNIG